jgi:alpha-beta hydrolase superfamily lysophospholipase
MALPACEGTLFKYGPAAAHVAFQPASAPARANVIVALGGLTDGFFATPYLEPLAARAAALGWGLVTPLLRSSHTGWGVASLAQDVEDLARLSDHLGGERGAAALALVGHSTGCQDAVAYAGSQSAAPGPPHRPALAAIVLQAPVSDKEWLAGRESTAARLEAAAAAVAAGEPEALIGRAAEWDGAPLSAARWLSLAGDRGADDLFSSDLTGGDLEERLCKPLARVARVLVLGSSREQYAPPGADAQASARRLAAAIGPAAQAIVLDGDHSLAGVEEEAARVIADFVCAGA